MRLKAWGSFPNLWAESPPAIPQIRNRSLLAFDSLCLRDWQNSSSNKSASDVHFGCEGRSLLLLRLRGQQRHRICSGATGPSEDSSEFNVCERPFRPRRLNACALCCRAFSPKTGLFNLFSGTSPTVRGLTAPVAVDLRKGFRWNSGLLISDC